MSNGGQLPSTDGQKEENDQSKKVKKVFRYGNYNRYYGRRKPDSSTSLDPRLKLFPENFFKSKKILDIGCNVGAVTLEIAKHYDPQMILGIDIDSHLIGVARKNIKHYCDKNIEIKGHYPASFFEENGKLKNTLGCDEKIFKINHFPDNVWFQHENYVLESDYHLEAVEPEYDIILALSITKWIHMNFGDDGMKRFFKRIFLHLRPGGKLVLECQDFKSYYKKAKQDKELLKNYKEIKFKPDDFKGYLLSDEVGFVKHEELGLPQGTGEGYDRVIEVFIKDTKPNHKRKRKMVNNNGEKHTSHQEIKAPNPKVIKFHDSDED